MFCMFLGPSVPPISQGNLLDDLGGLPACQTGSQLIVSNGTGNARVRIDKSAILPTENLSSKTC